MRTRAGMVLALAAMSAACASGSEEAPRMTTRRAAAIANQANRDDRSRCDATRPGRTVSEYDTNRDGVPDVRKVYQTMGEGAEVHSVLVCREVDLNHDGSKDVFRFYNDEGRTLREEADRDFDGHIDVITYYEGGEVVREEYDTNRDGMVDMRLFFRDHRPFRAERELQQDNTPDFRADYWEFYDTRGHVVRIGWDYDHDGRADRWDRVDRVAPIRPAANASVAPAAPATDADGGAIPGATADASVAPAAPAQPSPATTGTTPPN